MPAKPDAPLPPASELVLPHLQLLRPDPQLASYLAQRLAQLRHLPNCFLLELGSERPSYSGHQTPSSIEYRGDSGVRQIDATSAAGAGILRYA